MLLSAIQKDTVRNLRAKGLTYSEIQASLGIRVAKSTLSYVCRNVQMDDVYKRRISAMNITHARQVQSLAVARNKQLQAERLALIRAKSRATVDNLDVKTQKIALAMLYLGEGSKWKSYRGLRLGNSDPEIIKLYILLLQRCYDMPLGKLRARVQCRADQNVMELEMYWSKVTSLPLSQFHKAGVDARTQGKPTKIPSYRGVCVIICPGTEVQLELASIAKELLNKMGL